MDNEPLVDPSPVTWAPHGIRVNGITPGGTSTEMIEGWESATPGVVAQIEASTPMGRMAEPPGDRRGGRVAPGRSRVVRDRGDPAGRRRGGGLSPSVGPDDPSGPSLDQLSAVQIELLGHLMAGRTGDEIARRMRIGRRSVHRQVEAICDLWDVETVSAVVHIGRTAPWFGARRRR